MATQVRQIISGTPTPNGIVQLQYLTDIDNTNKQDGRVLVYDSDLGKHVYVTTLSTLEISTSDLTDVSGTIDSNYGDRDIGTILFKSFNSDTFKYINVRDHFRIDDGILKIKLENINEPIFDYETNFNAGVNINGGLNVLDGHFSVDGYQFPVTDGQAGMALITDGEGQLTFAYAGDSTGIVVSEMKDLHDVWTAIEPDSGDYLRFDPSINSDGKFIVSNFDSDVKRLISVISNDSSNTMGSLSYNDGIITFDPINVYDIKNLFSVVSDSDSDRFGSLTYDDGRFEFSRITKTDIKNLFSASGDLTYNDGEFSITLPYTNDYNSSDFDSDLASKTTDDLTEGNNLYYTSSRADSDAKRAVQVSNVSGFGSLSYDEETGTISLTGVSSQEIRSQISLSGNTLATYDSSNGTFYVNDSASFVNLTVTNILRAPAFQGDVIMLDNSHIIFGNDSDASIVYDGTDVVFDTKGSIFKVQGDLTVYDSAAANKYVEYSAGIVTLYHSGNQVFQSMGTGIEITGEIVADSASFTNLTATNGVITSSATTNNLTSTNTETTNITVTSGIIINDVNGVTITNSTNTMVSSYVHNDNPVHMEVICSVYDSTAGETQLTKFLVTFDTINVASVEYGTVYTGVDVLGSFSVGVNSGAIQVYFEKSSLNDCDIKIAKNILI